MLVPFLITLTSAVTLTFGPPPTFPSPSGKMYPTKIDVEYSIDRLDCKPTEIDNQFNYTVSIFYRNNNQNIENLVIANYKDKDLIKNNIHLDLQPGNASMWFECSNGFGKIYDSDFGKNYNFQIK